MKRSSLIFSLSAIFLLLMLLWLQRVHLSLLSLIKYQKENRYGVADHREIDWQQGPIVADSSVAQRRPNIILIIVDDLGFNDISTFGSGVSEGLITTPNIDKLAVDGVIFDQSYAGTVFYAPSRAMAMTGHYPTSTGYELTPTPDFMGPMSAMIQRASGSSRAESIVHSGPYLPEDHPNVVNAKLDFDPIDQFLWAPLGYSASFYKTLFELFGQGDEYIYWPN